MNAENGEMSGDPRYPGPGPAALGLTGTLERAARSPLFSRKLARAGVHGGAPLDWNAWRKIPPTNKDELRALDAFEEGMAIAPRSEVVEYWRSGGVTGRPLFYPRTARDVEESLTAFARTLSLAGLRREDTFLCALPIGVHPAGQQMVRAAERLGAATIWAGAGNQTPSSVQIELVRDFGVTVWAGMASFGLHLAHLAEGTGRPLALSRVRTVICTAEVLSTSKRELLGRLWGARVVDVFGMSEVTLMGGECGRRPGLHVWRAHSFCEVLDPETLKPVPPGEVGALCVTPVTGTSATPFLRWLSGDIVRMEFGCGCDHGDEPRLIHSGRTAAFFKVKGVNLNHAEVEDAIYEIPSLRDFRVTVAPDDRLVVEIESADGQGGVAVQAVDSLFSGRFGCRAEISTVERGTIARALEGQIKAQRFVDQRAQ